MSRRRIPLVVVALTTFSLPTHAATRAEQTRACRGDAIRLCSLSIPRGEKKVTACMIRKLDQLTPECRAMFHRTGEDKAARLRHQRS